MTNQTKQEVTLNDLKQALINEIYGWLNSGYDSDLKVEVVDRFIDALMKLILITAIDEKARSGTDTNDFVNGVLQEIDKFFKSKGLVL